MIAPITLRVPAKHVDRMRRTLLETYSNLAEHLHKLITEYLATGHGIGTILAYRAQLRETDRLIEQLRWTAACPSADHHLHAQPDLLADLTGCLLVNSAEDVAAACFEYTDGKRASEELRTRIRDLADIFELVSRTGHAHINKPDAKDLPTERDPWGVSRSSHHHR